MKFIMKILPTAKKWYPCTGSKGYTLGIVILNDCSEVYHVATRYFGSLGPLTLESDADAFTVIIKDTPVAEFRIG